MDDLCAQFLVPQHGVERALDNFKKIGKANLTYGIVRQRLSLLRDHFAKCEVLHGQILASASKEARTNHPYFTEDTFSKCEDTFYTTSDCFADWLHRLEAPFPTSSPEAASVSPSHFNATRSSLHLPRIQLPKFSGEFHEWEAFRDQFTSLVIDNREFK